MDQTRSPDNDVDELMRKIKETAAHKKSPIDDKDIESGGLNAKIARPAIMAGSPLPDEGFNSLIEVRAIMRPVKYRHQYFSLVIRRCVEYDLDDYRQIKRLGRSYVKNYDGQA